MSAPTPDGLAEALGLPPPTPEQSRVIAHPLRPSSSSRAPAAARPPP